jgi:hypothetical protein
VDFSVVAAVLRRVVAAQAADEQIGASAIEALASELDVHPTQVTHACEFVAAKGLAWIGEEGLSARIRRAGRQYLALEGKVDRAVLSFLPRYIEDLNARRALISAGSVFLDEYQGALLGGRGVDFAQGLVPEAFESVVTERLALRFYAAAVALLVRLSDEEPAGCVAEEIVAVRLMQEAEAWLDMEVDEGEIDADEASAAAAEFQNLFELFEDDDVLDLFEMEEPADAAVARHSARNRQLGIADQRVQAWFEPFSWTIPTGYLSDRSSS